MIHIGYGEWVSGLIGLLVGLVLWWIIELIGRG